jgi:hypothetical protein
MDNVNSYTPYFTDKELQQQCFPASQEIVNRFSLGIEVVEVFIPLVNAFSITFIQLFVTDTPNYQMENGNYGASRSNWTYHTALSLAQTSKIMNLNCLFEAQGKRDAIIETRDEKPEVILIAEWEWDYKDIFGTGKELEKLQESCKRFENAQAFLLTYCPAREYVSFFQRIAEYWIEKTKYWKTPPLLFLHTIVFEEEIGGTRIFTAIRTAQITPTQIYILNDQPF